MYMGFLDISIYSISVLANTIFQQSKGQIYIWTTLGWLSIIKIILIMFFAAKDEDAL